MFLAKLKTCLSKTDVEKGIPEETDEDTTRPLLQPAVAVQIVDSTPANPTSSEQNGAPTKPQTLVIGGEEKLPAIRSHPRLLHLTIPPPPGGVTISTATSPGSTPSPPTASEALPRRWRRSDRRLRRLNTELLEAIEAKDYDEMERLLNRGASPNATCRLDLVSACHLAAMAGGRALEILLRAGAEPRRLDRLARTPLHLASWAGGARQVAVLLGIPQEIQDRLDSEDLSSAAEDDIRRLSKKTKEMANMPCDLGEVKLLLPKDWKDNIDHNCRDITGTLPLLKPGWTPLHVASAGARSVCTKLLLAAGADPNFTDVMGCTALDVAGTAVYYDMEVENDHLTDVIRKLIKAGGKHNTMKIGGLDNINTPLHVAALMDNQDAVRELLGAGASIASLDSEGLTPLHVCVKKELEDCLHLLANSSTNESDPLQACVDVVDVEGHTVLQAAVEAEWLTGVCVALEAGADVTIKAHDGDTPLHSAAASGNVDVVNEILSVSKQKSVLECRNDSGETPLYIAIKSSHIDCVKSLLNEGASIKTTLPGDLNVLHVASEIGDVTILKVLLEHNKGEAKDLINDVSTEKRGVGPIHLAVFNNNAECVQCLLENGADIRLRTRNFFRESTPLHLASVKNIPDIAKIILNYDKTTLHEVNSTGWFPLHAAAHHGSRDVIPLLLQNGADLAGYTDGPRKYRKTAIDMLIHNLPKPTDYLEELFDSYVTINDENIQDKNCIVTLDYSILMPRSCEMEQMKVVEAILKTGNRYGQERLLVHPLLESFLYFKWKALLPFFYTILAFYAIFLGSLTTFTVAVFFYKDTSDEPPAFLSPHIWGYIVYSTILLILLQELLYMNVKSSRYFLQLETWIKFGSIGLAAALPPAVQISMWASAEWPRHVATLALLLSWIEMMFLLSRFPNWGYYVLMFGKVAINVVKILSTFAFLVIGFSLSFMIQFHSEIPFEGPWSAIVKTIVMMTSEFDYQALFDEEHVKQLSTSVIITRLIFLVFLILAAIVLMNLLVGVAVNDINDLEVLGNIRRLVKQVEFLGTLDILVYNRFFRNVLPKRLNNSVRKKRNVANIIELYPGRPRWKATKILPTVLRDAILNKATSQKKQVVVETAMMNFNNKIQEIYDAVIVKSKEDNKVQEKLSLEPIEERIIKDKFKKRYDDIVKQLDDLDAGMVEMKEQLEKYVDESKTPIEKLNARIDKMATDFDSFKTFLVKLESKLDKL